MFWVKMLEEFKYRWVLFTSAGKMEQDVDRQIEAALAVMQILRQSVVLRRELSQKAKLSIYRSIYVPALNYCHGLWVVTKRMRSQIQVAKMSCCLSMAGLSLTDEGAWTFGHTEADPEADQRQAGVIISLGEDKRQKTKL